MNIILLLSAHHIYTHIYTHIKNLWDVALSGIEYTMNGCNLDIVKCVLVMPNAHIIRNHRQDEVSLTEYGHSRLSV